VPDRSSAPETHHFCPLGDESAARPPFAEEDMAEGGVRPGGRGMLAVTCVAFAFALPVVWAVAATAWE
jgi:hypothetical protein